jgi:hypothetical protein
MKAVPDRTPWTIADVRRAIRAVESAGKPLAAVDFPREGGFRLLIGEPVSVAVALRSGRNEWDDVLAS